MSALQNLSKATLRVAKNYTKGYSDTQAKVRDATSNDPWGPSGTQMNELAQMTYNQNDFVEVMEMLDKRLNDKGKNWRHVFKSLTLLDYCLHAGSENVVIYFRDNLYVIKTLREFQYIDEDGKDQGANVRQKAKDIVNLLQDEARLRHERKSRAHMRDRMVSGKNNYDDDGGLPPDENSRRRRSQSVPPRGRRGDDDQLKKAIEESKRTAAAEQAKLGHMTAEERDLAEAIKLSKDEENKRHKAVEDSNANSLFDDTQQLSPQNQGFGLIDPSAYTVGLQPQMTAMQPQFTSFNPYQQQAQQEAMQQEYLRQQQEWMLQQQQQAQAQEMMAAQQQQAQQEEWMRQQLLLQQQQQQQQQFAQFQAMQQQQLQPQPTGFGSNNPFALGGPTQSPQPPMPQNNFDNTFNLQGTYANGAPPSLSVTPSQPISGPSSAPPQQRGPTRADQENAQLANLLANRGDGMDTFGNVGNLRYGGAGGQRLLAQQTGAPGGNNPFARPQQQQQSADQPFFSV